MEVLTLFLWLLVASEAKSEKFECIGLYKYPGWLAIKYNEYTKHINTTWVKDLNVPSGHLSKNDIRTIDNNKHEPFWREKFANLSLTSSRHYQETYKRNALAMFHKHNVSYKYLDEDGVIPDIDLQFISEKSFPEEYGINTTCEFNPKIVEVQKKYLWPDRTIPLCLDIDKKEQKDLFIRGLNALQYLTCVRFVPAKKRDHFVWVSDKTSGCSAYVGMSYGGRLEDKSSTYQNMSLGKGCFSHNTVIHETMHTLGFPHEHQRFDRDIYVNVNTSNIRPNMAYNYKRIFYPHMPKTPYKYDSVMHYFSRAFSIKGRNAMIKRLDNSAIRGGRFLTLTDVNRINYMYGCTEEDTADNLNSLDDIDFPTDANNLPDPNDE